MRADPGRVYLVGAGPGDPRLLTIHAVSVLKKADVVVYDRLIHPNILDLCAEDAERIYVGKEHQKISTSQDAINQLLVQHALAGRDVVRLKGGDPLLFGRGGEEAEVLAAQNIPFEIIPGLSSSLASLAYAGIPVTHRQIVQGVSIVGGFRGEFDYPWRDKHAWIVLMGLEHVQQIVDTALSQGFPATLPACAIEWGTWGHQRTVQALLQDLPDAIHHHGLQSPCLLVFGENVNVGTKLSWFESEPHYGQRVLIVSTYPLPWSQLMNLREHGAEVFNWSVHLKPVADDPLLQELSSNAQVYLDEASLLEPLLAGWKKIGRDIRHLPSLMCPTEIRPLLQAKGFTEVKAVDIEELWHSPAIGNLVDLYVPWELSQELSTTKVPQKGCWTRAAKKRVMDPLWDYHLQTDFDVALILSQQAANWYMERGLCAQSILIAPHLQAFFESLSVPCGKVSVLNTDYWTDLLGTYHLMAIDCED
ncbi:uroporphyrinogen-III C-methyltransferase [Sulfobacillus thermosulfidooxidans]|uniref:uroporphyrinogen-III C-methyltransferase n=1 Tax=Sulfobacillus thermosulfidooxidans TaxID=28034 RepID=UPI0006B54D84|nr:uroporphyrinogen-III C-methyltransferase [Sulfobacillus thermosulfidooxidans]